MLYVCMTCGVPLHTLPHQQQQHTGNMCSCAATMVHAGAACRTIVHGSRNIAVLCKQLQLIREVPDLHPRLNMHSHHIC
jgi:DNA-directed RNA polymerase subunit RPC12/RpoP